VLGLQRASVGPRATKNVAKGRPAGSERGISCRACIVVAIATSRAGGGADRHRRCHLPPFLTLLQSTPAGLAMLVGPQPHEQPTVASPAQPSPTVLRRHLLVPLCILLGYFGRVS
jgi:hypothetical protein